jgi:hypothetical protein
MGCGYVVSAVLIGFGLLMLWVAQTAYREEQPTVSVLITAAFGLLTVFAGFAILRPMRRAVHKQRETERLRAAHPDKPWTWRPEWRGHAIESRDRAGLWVLWFFALFWNGLSFPAAIAVLLQPDIERGAYFVFIFPLIGVALLYAAIHKTIRARKFGRPVFVPSTMPGAIGGYLGGVIEIPARVAIERDARLALKCVRRITTGSGKNSTTRENVIWEREERIPREKWTSDLRRTEIPVLFHIPDGSEPSDNSNANNQLLWLLTASAEVRGVDFESTFEVPVFDTGEKAPPPDPRRPALDVYESAPPDAVSLRESGITRSVGRFHFASSHLTGSRVVFSIVALVLAAVLAAFALGDVPLVVWGVMGFMTALFGGIALDLWIGSYELRIEGADVIVRHRGVFGVRETRVPRADVARIEPSTSMTAGSIEYFRLKLLGREGVDPAAAAPGEHFQARKQRYRMQRLARQPGVADPARTEEGARLLEAMSRTPRFAIEFAKHIPGRANAERIAAMVMAEIQG